MTGQATSSDQRRRELAATRIWQTRIRKSEGPTSERQNTISLEPSSEARPLSFTSNFKSFTPSRRQSARQSIGGC